MKQEELEKKLQQLLQEKQNTLYGVKGFGDGNKAIENVDMTKRSVDFVGNTYYYVDKVGDVLVKGAAKKSINDNGPKSETEDQIRHQSDHFLDLDHIVGKLTYLNEEEYAPGKYGLTATSYIPEHAEGNKHLINYQMRIYSQHSIGFLYRNVEVASLIYGEKKAKDNWKEYYPQLLNPSEADRLEYFFVVKEIELWEISVVNFAANKLTPYLGAKGVDNNTLLTSLFMRLDSLKKQYGENTKSSKKNIELQIKQIKQMMNEIINCKPSTKDTLLHEPSENDTLMLQALSNAISDFKLY